MSKERKSAVPEKTEATPEGETLTFFITRREIAENTRELNDPDISVKEYPLKPQLPTILKCKGRTYAMLYGTDKGVHMTVRIPDYYANDLGYKYRGVRQADFPHAPNWYCIPVEGAFKDKEEVYRILFEARIFLNLPKNEKVKSSLNLIAVDNKEA